MEPVIKRVCIKQIDNNEYPLTVGKTYTLTLETDVWAYKLIFDDGFDDVLPNWELEEHFITVQEARKRKTSNLIEDI